MLVPLAKLNGAPSVDPLILLIAAYPEGFPAGERSGLAEHTGAVRLSILALQDRGWSLCRVVVIIDRHAIDGNEQVPSQSGHVVPALCTTRPRCL
jgi:hypothetical protein